MEKRKKEFYVGFFVLTGLLCVAYILVALGEVNLFSNDRYKVFGYFSSVSGLKQGARVEAAGVPIGQVDSISIDRDRLVAIVVFSIDKTMELSEDSIASIKTSGIIGDKYVDISPGGSDILLEPGDEIENTESTLDIESLIRKFIFKDEM